MYIWINKGLSGIIAVVYLNCRRLSDGFCCFKSKGTGFLANFAWKGVKDKVVSVSRSSILAVLPHAAPTSIAAEHVCNCHA